MIMELRLIRSVTPVIWETLWLDRMVRVSSCSLVLFQKLMWSYLRNESDLMIESFRIWFVPGIAEVSIVDMQVMNALLVEGCNLSFMNRLVELSEFDIDGQMLNKAHDSNLHTHSDRCLIPLVDRFMLVLCFCSLYNSFRRFSVLWWVWNFSYRSHSLHYWIFML